MSPVALTWADLWAEAMQALPGTDDARHIVEEASGFSGAAWLLSMDTVATETAAEKVRAFVQRRLAGEPLQYVLGTWDFRQLRLHVDRRVLIPRPETEQVVQAALDAVAGRSSVLALDLGTGSGAIALSLATELSSASVHAVDASSYALEVASLNAARVGAEVSFHHGSWFDPLPRELRGSFDLIVSNPPYVAVGSEIEPIVVDWEPASALFAGPDGLNDIRLIVAQAFEWLSPGGHLIVELAPTQAAAALELAPNSGFTTATIGTDLAGRQRWLHATLASPGK